jgi:hypothetical protein
MHESSATGQALAPARHRARKRKLLLLAAFFPVWLLAAEMLFRGWCWIDGNPYRAAEARAAIVTRIASFRATSPLARTSEDATANAPDPSWHAHPYYGFENPAVAAAIDRELELRAAPRDPSEYTLFIVGGSVAMGFEPAGTEVLRRKLLEDPRFAGRSVRIVDCGQPAYKEPQQLMFFAYLLDLGIAPDALINLDGFNEAAFAWNNIGGGVSSTYPEFGIWAHQVRDTANDRAAIDALLDVREIEREVASIGELALRYRLYESSLLGRMTLARLARRASLASSKREHYVAALAGNETLQSLRGPRFGGRWAVAVEAAVKSWMESSRCLQDLCRARSIHYVHVLQPTLFDAGSKPLTASEIATQGDNRVYIDGVHALYPRFHEAGRALSAQGVNFHDCSMVFAESREPLYIDHCHFKARGNEILAARIAEVFLTSLPPANESAHAASGR